MIHLVRSHLGGLYTSNKKPEEIEKRCIECNGRDLILFSWDPKEENSKINAFIKYYIDGISKSKDNYRKTFLLSRNLGMTDSETYGCLTDDIKYDHEESYNYMTGLHEDGVLSDKEYERLILLLSRHKVKETIKLNEFASTLLPQEEPEMQLLLIKPENS